MRRDTLAVHGHEFFDERLGVFIPPIYLSAVFEQRGETLLTDRGSELKYSREENPTTRAFEKIMSKLERGVDSLAFNSGMSAITTLFLSLLEGGDVKILSLYEMYGTSFQFLNLLRERFGVKIHFSMPDTSSILEDISSFKPDIVFVESITNPTLKVVDVREIGGLCRDLGCRLVVDNTFASPVLLNPIEHGASYVIHSVTKYISGHNDVVGGVIVFRDSRETLRVWDWRRIMGSIMSPFEAYLSMRGVKTLSVRFERESKTALAIAEFLQEHPQIEKVYYLGLSTSPYKNLADRLFNTRLYGGVVSFVVRGGREKVLQVMKRVRIIHPSPSLGGVESLLTYPIISASKNIDPEIRARVGIEEGLLRLSVGLEDPEDLIEDLDQALR
ncbi:MAG: cystathionine gamma-synthase family protein [Sulfolobales archaeon]